MLCSASQGIIWTGSWVCFSCIHSALDYPQTPAWAPRMEWKCVCVHNQQSLTLHCGTQSSQRMRRSGMKAEEQCSVRITPHLPAHGAFLILTRNPEEELKELLFLWVCARVCMCVWTEGDSQEASSTPLHLVFWDTVSQWTWSSSTGYGPFCLCAFHSLNLGLQAYATTAKFLCGSWKPTSKEPYWLSHHPSPEIKDHSYHHF